MANEGFDVPANAHAAHAFQDGTIACVDDRQNEVTFETRVGFAAADASEKRRSTIAITGRATRYRQPLPSCCTCALAMLAKPRF
jgi:hypothetical protein